MESDILRAGYLGLLGLVYLLAGYRWTRFMTRLAAGVLFAVTAGLIARDGFGAQSWIQIAAMLVAGVLGYVLGDAIYYLLIVLTGAAAGTLLASAPVGGTESAAVWLLLLGAVAGGVLALLLERPILIVATSILGGFMLAGLVELAVNGALPRSISVGALGPAALASWAGLAALGCLVQALDTRRRTVVVAPADSVAVAEVEPVHRVKHVRRVRWFQRRRVG